MIEPEDVRDAALDTPGVLAMHAGAHGTAATFSASGRIWGVRLTAERIDVHVVAQSGRHLLELGRAVQQRISARQPDYAGRVVVHIEDIGPTPPTAEPNEVAAPAAEAERTEDPRRTP